MLKHETPLAPVVDDYLQGLPDDEQRLTNYLAGTLYTHRTRGSDAVRLEAVALTPVAARYEEDGDKIWQSLKQRYDSLEGEEPESELVLSLNHPLRTPRKYTIQAEEAVQSFQLEFPDFPLSYFTAGYQNGTPIGTVRRHLANAGLAYRASLRSQHRNKPATKDLLLMMSDIDEEERSPLYTKRMLEVFRRSGVIAVRGRTEYPATGFPNIDGLLKWYSMPHELDMVASEANIAVSVRDVYVPAGGHDAGAVSAETIGMVKRAPHFQARTGSIETAPEAVITTSNRHLVRAALDPQNPSPPWDITYDTVVGSSAHRKGDFVPSRDVHNKRFNTWVGAYQRDMLENGSVWAYLRGGKEKVTEVVAAIQRTREQFGGPELPEAEVQTLVARAISQAQEMQSGK